MGEKVQIFVRLQDRNLKTIAEFALHEPYGGGIFSAMNALHLVMMRRKPPHFNEGI